MRSAGPCGGSLDRSIASSGRGECKAAPGGRQSFRSLSRHAGTGFSAAPLRYDPRDREPIVAAQKTDPGFVPEPSVPRTLEGALEGRDPSLGSIHLTRSFGSARAPRWRRKIRRAATRATIRWCLQKHSIAPALRLVVIRGLPLELAHQVEQTLLPPPCNEFLEGLRDRSLFGAFAADFERPLDQFGVNRQVRCHVSISTHIMTQTVQENNGARMG